LVLAGVLGIFLSAVMTPAMAAASVSNAWVRATVQGQTATGAYMVINSDQDLTLVGADLDIAGRASLHEMSMHGDMMMMMPIESLAIPAGHPVALDEHNYHIMLEDLRQQIKPGEKIGLTLKFIDAKGVAQTVKVAATVRELASQAAPAMHMHEMGHE